MTLDLTDVDLPTEVVRTDRLVLRPHRPDDEDVKRYQAADVLKFKPVPELVSFQ